MLRTSRLLSLAIAVACASASAEPSALAPNPVIRAYFTIPSPEGLTPLLAAIHGARSSIHMMMFHLTEETIVSALLDARSRGVDVRVILDGRSLDGGRAHVAKRLIEGGVIVTESSPDFSITHVKALAIDRTRLIVMSLNLTTTFATSRDFAVTTIDRDAVSEYLRVFDADVANAGARSHATPPLTSAALVWSPVDSEVRLVALIDEARSSIVAMVENLREPAIEAAFVRAVRRGVRVRILVPLCGLNRDPLFNVPSVRRLDAAHVDARVMPPPATIETPYVHGKMIVADGVKAYVGSINFTSNSIERARELGIIFDDRAAITSFARAFEADWSYAIVPPEDLTNACAP